MSVSIEVELRQRVPIDVDISRSSSADGDLGVYSEWLQLDGGNPFSIYSDDDVVVGGAP